MRNFSLLLCLLLICAELSGQTLSSIRSKYISTRADTVQLDTLSIAPHSAKIWIDNSTIDTSAFTLDFIQSKIVWNKNSASYRSLPDSVKINYRVFSFFLGKEFRSKSPELITKSGSSTPLYYNPGSDQPEIFRMPGLTRNGSISRGITFGNNQDVFVNSSLNLQLAGKLSDNVEILAAITDENIPVQPEGNTQQLQDFDKVFIQLSNNKHRLIAGDFELKRPDSYFMNFFKKGQGAYFTTENSLVPVASGKKRLLRSGVSLAVSKGKFARNTLEVREGNQGPYRLQGGNGELFIIVLSGTEKIYFNGLQLVRGAQNDYVIDYNTAEVTFTANRLITKDSRIVVEFEYSDKNYARSLIFMNNEFESEKLKVKLNVYSEQDSKNQPLTIELDSAKKAVMADAGDDILQAVFPTADSVEFNTNAVLYKLIDTLTASGIFPVYVYSNNPDSAFWQVSFSDVGSGNGDYIQDISSTNGRVYKWLEPVNGIRRGNFAPVALLITPKQQQMVTAGIEYQFNKRNSLSVEGAASKYDVNLFSNIDKANDAGYGTKVIYKNEIPLDSDTAKGWRLANILNYEYTGKNFKPIERFRNVEFERDWNLGTTAILNDEHISSLQTSLIRPAIGSLTYTIKSYEKGSDYRGLMNGANVTAKAKKTSIVANASYLTTDGLTARTRYFRHNADVSRPVWKLTVGMNENSEHNRFIRRSTDSLLANSFSFNEFGGYIRTIDTAKSKAGLSISRRIDRVAALNSFRTSTVADEANLTTEFSKNQNNTFRTTTTYRQLTIKDTLLTTQEPVRTILNRIDHSWNVWKGIFSFNTYYEVGTGQERRQEYYYLRVNDGQGVYDYIDENENGVQELNEFIIAAFQDKANYIRIYIPTNEYISTRSNQFSEVFVISPRGNSNSTEGKEKFIHRLSNQLSVRLERKTKEESLLSSLNPFTQDLADTALISATSNLRNTFYFNKINPVYGFDLTWQENRNKVFLTNGFETRVQRARIVNMRWNVNRSVLLNFTYENGDKLNTSDFFSNRDYTIYSNSVEPKFSYQPGSNFRATTSYEYADKKNTTGEIRERAISNRFQLDLKYTNVTSGNITAKIALINIDYNASDDSFLSYEMLEGLKNGKNVTWGAAMQRTLNNSVQLSLTYDGRQLQDSPVVHTGGVQFRAFF